MFWAHNQYSHSPQIDTILAKEDLTLGELFNQEGLFQELKAPNKNLIDFITRSDMLSELVRLVTEEPPTDLDLKERYKLANLACEVLTTDTPLINEKLSEHIYLTKLYSFLDSEPPLNPLLASFFSRTLGMLICRKHEQNWYSYQYTCLRVLDFFKSQESSLSKLVQHMGTSSIMELTLKLLTQIEGPELQNTLVYLVEQEDLVEKLIDLLHPSIDEDRNHNASNLLVDTICKMKDDVKSSASDTSNKRRDSHTILSKIQSEPMVKKILDNVFVQEVTESSIIGGVNVLLALICPPPVPAMGRRDICDDNSNGAGAGDPTKNQALFGNGVSVASVRPILMAIIPYLPTIHELLHSPPKREPIKLTCGILDPPLGQARLALVRLLAVLISTNMPEINEELDRLDSINLLLDLFFEYKWNNFLHSQVVKCLALDFSEAFEQSEPNDPSSATQDNWNLINPLVSNIFIKCNILDRIITGAQDNQAEEYDGQCRRGYMGHLMSIATGLWKALQESSPLARWVEENLKEEEWSAWKEWVKTDLTPAMARSSHCLGETHPMFQCDGASAPSDDILDKITLIKLKGSYPQGSDDMKDFFEASNQPQFPIIFHSEGVVPFTANMMRGMLQDDGNTDCEVTIFKQRCAEKESVWHDLSERRDFGSDQSNSSDEEDKDDDDNNDVWSSCNSMEPDSDPWTTSGGLDSDDSWADFESASSLSFSEVVQHGSAAAAIAAATQAHAEAVSALMAEEKLNECNSRLESSDDRMDEDEEPPQLFEVSPEPGEEMDDGGSEPPPLPSSPPPPLPTSPPPLPSAIPEAPPIQASLGDVRSPRPIAPPSEPPPPPPTHRLEAARGTDAELIKRVMNLVYLGHANANESDPFMCSTWTPEPDSCNPSLDSTVGVVPQPPVTAESPPHVTAALSEALPPTNSPEPASSATIPQSEASAMNPVINSAPVLAQSAAPVQVPLSAPTMVPLTDPMMVPITEPTMVPTTEPTMVPITEPTVVPLTEPTMVPLTEPTMVPLTEPSMAPLTEPTMVPLTEPSTVPSAVPTLAPTASPVAIAAASLIAEVIPAPCASTPAVVPEATVAGTCTESSEPTSEKSEIVPSTEVPEVTVPTSDLSNSTEEQVPTVTESSSQPIAEGSDKGSENASR